MVSLSGSIWLPARALSLTSFQASRSRPDQWSGGALYAYRATIVGSALFLAFVTSFAYVVPPKRSAQAVLTELGVQDQVRTALKASDTIVASPPVRV